MFKKTSLALFVSVSFGASAGSVNLDGHFGGDDNYDKVFAINYYNSEVPGSDPITGGVLALATNGDKQYVYISHPLGFKDLSYGTDDKYIVGWEGSKNGQDNLEKAIGSEFIALQLTSEEGDVYGVSFNPIPAVGDKAGVNAIGEYNPNTTDGKILKDASKVGKGGTEIGDGIYEATGIDDTNTPVNIKYLSTADYNLEQATDYDDNTASWYAGHSPETESCGSESSSDIGCYKIDPTVSENYIDKTDDDVNNATLIKWDFHWGLEIELDVKDSGALFFGDLANIDLGTFGYQNDAIISLDALHASEPKRPSECGHDTCDADVVHPDDSTPVPEPSTFAIFSLALAGLWARKRRSLNND